MLKRSITYKDFDDREVTEIFYFNLSHSEMIELEAKYRGGNFLQRIVDSDDREEIIKQFKDIILRSYGEKSEDGKRFVKSDKIREEFSQTAAYDALFLEVATNTDRAAEFMLGVIPKDLAENVKKQSPEDKPFRLPPSPPTP